MNGDELLHQLEKHNISLMLDPDWNQSLGPEKWMAIKNMKLDKGFMGSEWTGYIEGDGFTGDFVSRGETALEALVSVLKLIDDSL